MKPHRAAAPGETSDQEEGNRREVDADHDMGAGPTRKDDARISEVSQCVAGSALPANAHSTETGRALTMEFWFNGRPLRADLKDGQTWFAAADVCAVLEIANSRAAISRLEDDEKGVATADTLGGEQEINTINESGLYSLIFQSRKPEARAFRRWVTGEVLPSIRKTGHYVGAFGGVGATRKADDGRVSIELPREGRFVITFGADGTPHVHDTDYYDATCQQLNATDCRILCHSLHLIEGFWHKFQQVQSVGVDPTDGFAVGKLGETIVLGGRIARQYLVNYNEPRFRAAQRHR